MESENVSDPYDDNRDVSRQSLQNTKRDSRASSLQKHKKQSREKSDSEDEKDRSVQSRSKTRIWNSDPDRDRISNGEGRRSSGSFYSEDYENESPSDRSLSPYSRSRTPSPVSQRGLRAKRIPNNPVHKTGGVGRIGMSRPHRPGGQFLTNHHRRGVRSQSKESSPPKDLDLVTKRMLSARLLKINELRNALAELQQRIDELQKENRILRQLQVRQEKALQRYDDTESEISQLISRHSNEMQVLRERLRRTQERERASERRLKDSEEQLQRSHLTIARLKKLVSQRDLGERDELNRRLEEEKTRAQEAERKIKELERSTELGNSSYQRQLVAEKKKTLSAQDEIKTLQEELERLTNKLREKERELDTRNIYANRMVKPSLKKETDSSTGRKVPSRSSSKAVQTEGRASSLDFPTPPPAISDASESCEQAPDEYLSLKPELDRQDKRAEVRPPDWEELRSKGKERNKEKDTPKDREWEEQQKQPPSQALNRLEEKTRKDGSEKEKVEEDTKKSEEDSFKKRGHVQDEVNRWNQESRANEQAAEEARRKKEQLLAKMREIDLQNQGKSDLFFESRVDPGNHPSPRPPEQKKRNSSLFSLTETEGFEGLPVGSNEGGRRRTGVESETVTTGMGRRALRSQSSKDDLAFGGYAPSFGNLSSRVSPGFPPPPPKEDGESAFEAIGVFSLREVGTETDKEAAKGDGKDKKASLMHQLFGAQATSAGNGLSSAGKMELLSSPPTINGVRPRREGLFNFSSGTSTPPGTSITSLHVADSRPAVRAVPSFDDDIEELTL